MPSGYPEVCHSRGYPRVCVYLACRRVCHARKCTQNTYSTSYTVGRVTLCPILLRYSHKYNRKKTNSVSRLKKLAPKASTMHSNHGHQWFNNSAQFLSSVLVNLATFTNRPEGQNIHLKGAFSASPRMTRGADIKEVSPK